MKNRKAKKTVYETVSRNIQKITTPNGTISYRVRVGFEGRELSNKLNIAAGTGNAHLCDQIRMALETFRNKYQDKFMVLINFHKIKG